jgi:hypothetical protein
MKQLLMFSALAFFLSCSNDNRDRNDIPEEPRHEAPPVTNPAPPATKEEDGTTIKIDDEGFDMKSKDGDDKTEIKIGNDTTGVEIKRDR